MGFASDAADVSPRGGDWERVCFWRIAAAEKGLPQDIQRCFCPRPVLVFQFLLPFGSETYGDPLLRRLTDGRVRSQFILGVGPGSGVHLPGSRRP
jgi:hypothetical protein